MKRKDIKESAEGGGREYPKGFSDWKKLPNKTLVSDLMSFQLDDWSKDFDNNR